MTKVIIAIIVVAILGAGGWWYVTNNMNKPVPPAAPAPLVATQPVDQNPPAPTPGTPNTVTIPASGSSDNSLTQEAAEVDTQMNGLNADNASADSGLSSQ